MSLRDHYRQLLAGHPLLDLREAEPSAFTGLRPLRSHGQYRSIQTRLDGMRPGDQLNLLHILAKGSLPNVQSAIVFRANQGFIVSINHGQDIFDRQHWGPMTKDDLIEYLMQIKQEIVEVEWARGHGEKVAPIHEVRYSRPAQA